MTKLLIVLLFLPLATGCSSTSIVAEPEPETAAATAPRLPAPPWANEPISRSTAPAVFWTEWSKAENRESCVVIAPVSVPADARPRRATFYGGWAVAYDKPGSRGVHPSGESCESCGRGAFGLAGAGVVIGGSEFSNFDHFREWSDGSRAGYSGGGHGGQWLANIQIDGQKCLYQVWSYLGQEHLERLIDDLRFLK